MKNQLKGFLTITQNGVKMSVNPQLIETFQPYQTHDNPEIDKTLIVTSSGQTFIVDNKDFDPEGWEKGQEAKIVAQREAEKARREQEKKDLEEISRIEAEKKAGIFDALHRTQPDEENGGDEIPDGTPIPVSSPFSSIPPKRGAKPKGK